MGNATSTLTLRLLDQISGPAKKAEGSLKRLDSSARAVARAHRGGGLLANTGSRLASIATAAAGYAAVRGVSRAVTEYAHADRALTRVRITAEASAAEIQRAGLALRALAQETALPVEDLVSGLDVLVQSGLNLQQAMAFLPSVAATAQATNSSTEDIAKTAAAMSTSMKVGAKEMGGAFDALAVSGKVGQFEIKAMAQHLPRVAASAAKLGFAATDGVQRLGAMLQISKEVSGTAEQAAVGVADAFEKTISPTVLKAAKKHNLDFLKIIETAQRHGENGMEAIIRTLMKATAGMNDVRRNAFLSSIFTEADSRGFIVGMIAHWQEYQDALARVKASHGVVKGDIAMVTADAEAAIQRLSNAWNTFLVSSGKLAVDSGAGGFLEDLTIATRILSEGLAQAKDGADALFGTTPGDLWEKHVRAPARATANRYETERADPALKAQRLAQERLDALNAQIAHKEGTAAKNPVGRLFIEEQLKELRRQREVAITAQLDAGRLAAQAQHDAPDGVGPDVMGGITGIGGSNTEALHSIALWQLKKGLNFQGEAASAGASTMDAWTTAFDQQAQAALAKIAAFSAAAQSSLSFTAAPQIAPTFTAPAAPAAGGTGKQSRALTGSDVRRIVRNEGDTMYRHSGLG